MLQPFRLLFYHCLLQPDALHQAKMYQAVSLKIPPSKM